MTLHPLQWAFAVLGAVLVGLAKTAVSGLGVLAVALFTQVFSSGKQASGLVLPLLVFADVFAVISFRAHAQWRFLWKLFPWAALGVVLGSLALGRISDHAARLAIGGIIVALAGLSYRQRYRRPAAGEIVPPAHRALAPAVGVIAGFVTLIANASGPLMAVYFVSMRLPKMQYVGTTAVFFLLLNLFKVPFMAALGLITRESLEFNLLLLPAVIAGAVAGRWLLRHIDEDVFNKLVLALSAVSGLLLLAG